MNKKILVIGGGGYVGTVLVNKLLSIGHEVSVYDLFIYGNYLKSNNNLKIIQGDVRNIEKLKKNLKGIDTVIHLACISNDPSFELNPLLAKSINYDCFKPLVEIAAQSGISRFIYASSSSVYGIKNQKDVNENSTLEPLTDYSKFKAKCEEILINNSQKDFHPIILRPSTVNGFSPRQRLDVVVNIMTNLAYHKNKITVFGGEQLRPNIYMEDMIRAYLCVLEAPLHLVSGEAFNVGEENLTVNEIALSVKKELKKDVIIEKSHSDDNRSYHVSSSKIKKHLNFDLKHNINDGIRSLLNAFEAKILLNTISDEKFYNLKVLAKTDLL
jgi:nucleoside-diphosphate-sugar epimerase|tara:strand:+ start:412 stop:1392 length:981 start_codon:yes stop_codon:yes gene_type:complete